MGIILDATFQRIHSTRNCIHSSLNIRNSHNDIGFSHVTPHDVLLKLCYSLAAEQRVAVKQHGFKIDQCLVGGSVRIGAGGLEVARERLTKNIAAFERRRPAVGYYRRCARQHARYRHAEHCAVRPIHDKHRLCVMFTLELEDRHCRNGTPDCGRGAANAREHLTDGWAGPRCAE